MASYSVKFVNDASTKQVWTMAVYQTIPNMGVFDNVAWKQATAPQSGTKSVGWDLSFNVALADYYASGDIGVYESSQILSTNLGQGWQVVNPSGTQELVTSTTSVPGGYIYITNNSGKKANVGIGMSDSGSIYQRDMLSGSKAEFKVTPRYWASIFNNVVQGEVISTAISATDPVEVIFAGGITAVTLTAWVEGETLFFGDKSAKTGSFVATPMSLVQSRTATRQRALQAFTAAHPQLIGSSEL